MADYQAVDETLQRELDAQQEMQREIEEEAAKTSDFLRCEWYKRCYYCQRSDGRWYLVRCYA